MPTIEKAGPITLDIKAVADDGAFEGYASVFDVEDLGRDVVKAGAFARSLKARPAAKVKLLRGHDMSAPIGVWADMREDGKGLYAKGRLVLETVLGRETHALMKAGALDGLSIGYRTVRDTIDRKKGVRLLEEVDLVEVSIVTLAMNPAATVTSVKHHDENRARALVAALNRARAALR